MLAFQCLVCLCRLRCELHPDVVVYALGELDVVLRPHTDCNILYLASDRVTRSGHGHPVEDDVAVAPAGLEIGITVSSEGSFKPLASVKAVYLCPEVYQSVRIRCACKPYDPAAEGSDLLECLEALRPGILET